MEMAPLRGDTRGWDAVHLKLVGTPQPLVPAEGVPTVAGCPPLAALPPTELPEEPNGSRLPPQSTQQAAIVRVSSNWSRRLADRQGGCLLPQIMGCAVAGIA